MKTQPKRHRAGRMPMYGGWHDYQQWADHDFRPRASFDAFAEAAEDEAVVPSGRTGEQAFEEGPAEGEYAAWDDYDQAGPYDQADDYEQTGGYHQAEGYEQTGPYDQTRSYDRAEGYEQTGSWESGERWAHTDGDLGPWEDAEDEIDGAWDYDPAPTRITVDPYPTGLPVRPDGPVRDEPLPPGQVFSSASTVDYLDWPDADGDLYLDSPAAQMVRPYARTGGRTKSKYDLRLETLLSTLPDAAADYRQIAGDHEQICRLCEVSRSTAEVSAKLAIPLGVAKVLIGDVVDMGLVMIHDNELAHDDRPSFMLMQRVLTGLQRL